MAAPTHYLKKRDFLYSPKSTPAQLSAAAREYLQAESWSDALDFFERAHDDDGLKEIKQLALRSGDTFLLGRLDRIDKKWVSKEDWEQAKEKAREREIFSMAAFADRKLNPPEQAQDPVAPGTTPLEETATEAGKE